MNNVLIEASAGTGKTQALANRLIDLLKTGIKPEEIVAITFSRAAAGEIFERLVSLLAKQGETKLLRAVLASQHLSQIGTLDSFLMKIVRAFPEELGLDGEVEMMDESEAERERARISFSILRRTDPKTKATFSTAFAFAMGLENVRSFVESYHALIQNWHKHIAALPDESAWGEEETIWGAGGRFAKINETILNAAANQVDAILGQDAKWHQFAEWVRAFRGRIGTPVGITKKLLDSEETFKGDLISFTFNRHQYDLSRDETRVVRDALMAVFSYTIRQKLELARGIYRLISVFETDYAKKVRATGKLVFADIPRLLASLPEASRRSLEYRMDAHIRAWALDEFQDTSREQWEALKNLIDEAKQSSGEKSVFIVGDRKQAIYGWRNGDVSIFTGERTQTNFYTLKELNKTYRSSPAIVQAVNRIFARGRIFDEFPTWESPEHLSAHPQMPGFVRVMEASGRNMDSYVEPVLTAARTIPQGVTAAILVRNNKFGEFLASELKSAGLKHVVWEGESAILDTPALSGFLDLFQLADHPSDLVTYRHFKLTPVAKAMYPNGAPDLPTLSNALATSFTTRGIVRTLREVRAHLPDAPVDCWSVFCEERFTDMLRAAAKFELGVKAGTRLADFPNYLAAQKKRTLAESDQIKIITIHRSKGLGFDYVILPLYESAALNSEADGPLVGDNWILPDPGAKASRNISGLGRAYRLRKDREEQEALCAYYVAATRAKSAMTIICRPAATSDSNAIYFSDLVRSADLADLNNPEVVIGASHNKEVPPYPATTVPDSASYTRQPRIQLRRRLPSLQFQSGMSAATLFTAASAHQAARTHGTIAHAKMEKIDFSAEMPKPEGFVELWRERAFEIFADGEWISGRFDRVTFWKNAAGELSAEIIDFKTSIEHPERYDAQLSAYRKAIHALTKIPLNRITSRLQKI